MVSWTRLEINSAAKIHHQWPNVWQRCRNEYATREFDQHSLNHTITLTLYKYSIHFRNTLWAQRRYIYGIFTHSHLVLNFRHKICILINTYERIHFANSHFIVTSNQGFKYAKVPKSELGVFSGVREKPHTNPQSETGCVCGYLLFADSHTCRSIYVFS